MLVLLDVVECASRLCVVLVVEEAEEELVDDVMGNITAG